ncbi:MAG: hypothetical protein HZC28_01385 [Spirochaetes bacterium]|nr:hypothetical protein [Spirochaetota bacterium]
MVQEIEFNGSFAEAQVLNRTVIINGSIKDNSDEDFYRLKPAGTERAFVQLTLESTADMQIEIYDFDQKLIKTIDDAVVEKNSMSREEIRNLYIGGEHIAIRVTAKNACTYKLVVVFSPVKEFAEREPNDMFETATRLEPMTNTEGYYLPAGDPTRENRSEADYYYFENPTDIMGMFSISLSAMPGVDTALALFDGSREQIAVIDNGAAGAREELRQFLFPPESRYYLAVINKNRKTSALPYQLAFSTQRYDEKNENEPNDRKERAKEAAYNDSVQGKYDYHGDVDIYKMIVIENEGANVHIAVSAVERADPVLRITDMFDRDILGINNGGAGEGEAVPNLFLPQGIYYFYLNTTNRFFSCDRRYTFTAESLGKRSDAEWEMNDSPEKANRLMPGGTAMRGYIGWDGDKDYYRISVDDASTTLSIEALPPSNIDVVLRLYKGTALALTADRNGKGRNEAVEHTLDKGVWYLEVSSKEQYNPKNPYRIVTAVGSPK